MKPTLERRVRLTRDRKRMTEVRHRYLALIWRHTTQAERTLDYVRALGQRLVELGLYSPGNSNDDLCRSIAEIWWKNSDEYKQRRYYHEFKVYEVRHRWFMKNGLGWRLGGLSNKYSQARSA